MPHRDEAALLRAVRESPRDRMPLRLYADALEDRGHPLADYIRAGLALGELSGDEAGRTACLARRAELLCCHQGDWLAGLDDLAVAEPSGILFHASTTLDTFLDHLDRFAGFGALASLSVHAGGGFDPELFSLVDPDTAAAAAGLVAELDLVGLDLAGLKAVINFPPTSRLRRLGVSDRVDLEEDAADLLAGAPFAPYLERLRLPDWDGLQRLLAYRGLSSLAQVDLSGDIEGTTAHLVLLFMAANASAPGCEVIGWDSASSTVSSRMHEGWSGQPGFLDLTGVANGRDELVGLLREVGETPEAASVTSLCLRCNGLRSYWGVLAALGSAPCFTSLRSLDIGANYGDPSNATGRMNDCISTTLKEGDLPLLPRLTERLNDIIVPWEDDGYNELLPFPDKFRARLQRALPRTRIRVQSMMTGEIT